jgi:hypothetical protein
VICVWFSECTEVVSLHGISRLLVTETERVYCAVRTEPLIKILVSFSF